MSEVKRDLEEKVIVGTTWFWNQLQPVLDKCQDFRDFLFNYLAYTSIRIFGIHDCTFKNVKDGKCSYCSHQDRCLDGVTELDTLLVAAKDCHKSALDRRAIVMDKCKTLLAMSSFSLALAALFLPKSFQFDDLWMRVVFIIAGLFILDSVAMLVIHFGLAAETVVDLTQKHVSLDKDDFKKDLINQNLLCEVEIDNRTDYLIIVYRVARFFLLLGFSIVIFLFLFSYLTPSKQTDAEKVIQEIRRDPKLMELLRTSNWQTGESEDKGGQRDRVEPNARMPYIRDLQ